MQQIITFLAVAVFSYDPNGTVHRFAGAPVEPKI